MEKSKGRLFLLEIIIIILFFSIAAAVCAGMFAKAKTLSGESADLAAAVMLVQETAETFRAAGEIPAGAAYDADWRPVQGGKDAVYELKVKPSDEDGLLSLHISVSKDGTELFAVDAARYGGAAYEG